ncbi:MAG: acyl-CoA/acyl-ACP dehydrogenase [Chromatiales bacterium]|nr:acyl-CoA/acyl-ACP dehydrogenase [Chromatiales bacterium]
MQPRTDAGETLTALIADVTPTLWGRAGAADEANSMCLDNYKAVQASGIAAAFIPTEFGGLGLQSMHDWLVAIARLARGDGSVAIAFNMHFSATRGMAARFRACAPGTDEARRLESQMRQVAAGEMLICSTTTESGTDNLHPLTEAMRTDSGWSVSGTKYFVTMSPIATHVGLNVRTRDGNGDYIANVFTRMDAPGIVPGNNWDALGMRASGSQSVTFENCEVPKDALRIIGPWGQWSIPVLLHRTLANVPLVAAFLGIAESAYDLAVEKLKGSDRALSSGVQHAVAEMEIALATSQTMMTQMGLRLDAIMEAPETLTWEGGHELMKDYQSVKFVVNRHAIDIVSKAMDLAGGGGFASGNPLTRLYRDVRAGPFMQPYSPIDAREYVGKVTLDLWPTE